MRMQPKTLFKNESELEEIVVSILEKNFGLICKRQVRIDEKIPDILAYDISSGCLFGIEIKLKDCDLCPDNPFYPKGKCPEYKWNKCNKRIEKENGRQSMAD